MPKVLLLQEPSHELTENLAQRDLLVNIHLQGLRSSEVLLLLQDVGHKLRILNGILVTDLGEFVPVGLLLDDLDGLLADVEADVLGDDTRSYILPPVSRLGFHHCWSEDGLGLSNRPTGIEGYEDGV